MVALNSHSTHVNAAQETTPHGALSFASRQEALHDSTLVSRFNAGDEGAFSEIVARYRAKMFCVAFTRLRNHADAEEIAQDTFIRAHRGLATFRGESSLATWLHRITVNLASNRYWYFFRRRRHLTQSLDRPLSEENTATFIDVVSSDAPSPVRESMLREFSALVAKCMEQLNPAYREILSQRNALNCSYDQIATSLGINVGTVKSRIARARGSLRMLLAEACPEFSPDALPAEWFESIRPARSEPGPA
jgi:RNA polymerase sigma-70 factor (ECF subfamily)